MPLPQNFSPAEHLQDVVRRVFNPEVKEYFKDVGPADWDESLVSDRAHLRVACTHRDDDTIAMTQMRLQVFDQIRFGNWLQMFYPREQTPDVWDTEVVDNPKVKLYFAQDSSAVPEGRSVIQAEYSFRLMDQTPSTIRETDALTLARQIRSEFAATHPTYTWTKGKVIVSYKDPSRGYRLRIYGSTEVEAEQLIRKILAIRNHPFEEDKLTPHIPRRNSVNNPSGTELVYGKQRKKPRWRPTANVRFRWASLEIQGLPRDIMLVDTTGYFQDALVKA